MLTAANTSFFRPPSILLLLLARPRAPQLGFWVNLPHAIIEEAYRDKNIPDRYCTVALMAENRHLIKANEELTHMCESMNEAMKSLSAQ